MSLRSDVWLSNFDLLGWHLIWKTWKSQGIPKWSGKMKKVRRNGPPTTTDTNTDTGVIYCVILYLLQTQCIKCQILKAHWLPGLLLINVNQRLLTVELLGNSGNLMWSGKWPPCFCLWMFILLLLLKLLLLLLLLLPTSAAAAAGDDDELMNWWLSVCLVKASCCQHLASRVLRSLPEHSHCGHRHTWANHCWWIRFIAMITRE